MLFLQENFNVKTIPPTFFEMCFQFYLSAILTAKDQSRTGIETLQTIPKDADEAGIRGRDQKTSDVAHMRVEGREKVREGEELVAPPVMKFTVSRIRQKAVKEALKLMMIPQIIKTVTQSPKLDEEPHGTKPKGEKNKRR